jgi:hypothetical protein
MDATEVFRHAVYFEYVTLTMLDVQQAFLSQMPKTPLTGPMPPDVAAAAASLPPGTRIVQTWKDDLPPMTIPAQVNATLAVELYIKTLLVLQNGSHPYKHELYNKLFILLDPAQQQRIEQYYEDAFKHLPSHVHLRQTAPDPHFYDFKILLERHEMDFIEWRYSYDYAMKYGSFFQPVRDALRKECLQARPDWTPIFQVLNKRPTLLYRLPQ